MSELVKIRKVCTCGAETVVIVDRQRYHTYRVDHANGGPMRHIQMALPELSAEDREVLITGMCYACQAEMFAPPEDGDGNVEPVTGDAGCAQIDALVWFSSLIFVLVILAHTAGLAAALTWSWVEAKWMQGKQQAELVERAMPAYPEGN
jgi:hypothetical protein